ncbi:DUF2894 domain-containing protein [Marinobacter sp. VGCF2001]|uniref:DUF2894 domain-containing protein n=1 Tax=Marinobacter sp. VGCF2001 TaxID=3417189 RepID=UPI003CF96CF2
MTTDNATPSLLGTLKQSGADQWNPVKFRYLESLEQRLRTRHLTAGKAWQRLEQAVEEYRGGARVSDMTRRAPKSAMDTATAASSPLSDLLAWLNQPQEAPPPAFRSALEARIFGAGPDTTGAVSLASPAATPKPLNAMARAQAERGAQTLQSRIRLAIDNVPAEAGPMNAQRLVSRAIAEMHTLSPEYAERFARYTDTLMALERMSK